MQVITAAPGFQLVATVTSAAGGASSGAYGSAAAVREVLGDLLAPVLLEAPPLSEQRTILAGLFPDTAPLLAAAMATLQLMRRAPAAIVHHSDRSAY